MHYEFDKNETKDWDPLELFFHTYADLFEVFYRKQNRITERDLKNHFDLNDEESKDYIAEWENKGLVEKRNKKGWRVTEKGEELYRSKVKEDPTYKKVDREKIECGSEDSKGPRVKQARTPNLNL